MTLAFQLLFLVIAFSVLVTAAFIASLIYALRRFCLISIELVALSAVELVIT